jgi:hypothetical protein
LHLQKVAVDSLVRTARGLLLQCPVQERTRVQVITALERVAKRLKLSRVELERGECYIDVLGQFVAIMKERKVRLVEESSSSSGGDEFQLPPLGLGEKFSDGRSAGERGLGLLDDIDVPIRRIGTPTLTSASSSQTSKIDTPLPRSQGDRIESPIPQIITTTNITPFTESPSQIRTTPLALQSQHPFNTSKRIPISTTPSAGPETSSRVEKTNTTKPPIGSPLHMAEITRIVREVGF